MIKTMLILYVADQKKSSDFYKAILENEPQLDVPGMTEFELNEFTILGLMPEEGIHRIIGDAMPHPALGNGIPRCELYLNVEDPEISYKKLLASGGKPISESKLRDWGHITAYGADPDGHIIAFAKMP